MGNRRRPFVLAVAAVALVAGLPAAPALSPPHDRVVSDDPADFTPNVLDGKVNAVLPVGDRVFVGGTFTQVREAGGTEVLARRGLFAFDARTGAVDRAWVADVDADPTPGTARGVNALAATPDGGAIFAGGDFGTVNGAPRRKLVKLDGRSAALDAGFGVQIDQAVKDLAVSGSRLYVAGAFDHVTGNTREGLAAVDITTGALDPDVNVPFLTPRVPKDRPSVKRVESIAVTPDGNTLIAAGNFLEAGGQPRVQIAMLDVGVVPARLADWRTDRFDDRDSSGQWRCENFDSYLRDIDMAPDGSYFAVVTTGGNRKDTLCDSTSRWETAARGQGLQPTWVDYSGGDSFTGVAVSGAAIYVGGHNRWMNNPFPKTTDVEGQSGPGAVVREGIAALDPLTGLPLPWNPGRDRGEGAWALTPSPSGLWVGSDTDRIGRQTGFGCQGCEAHGKLAFFPQEGGIAFPSPVPASLPADLVSVGTDGAAAKRFFDGTKLGNPAAITGLADWSKAKGVLAVAGRVYWGDESGHFLTATVHTGDTPAPPGDGAALGPAGEVNLRGLTSSQFPVSKVTGMFYDNGRLYYTTSDSDRLYYRWFLPTPAVGDVVVGAQTFVASGDGDGLSWKDVKGMTAAGGHIYWSEGSSFRRLDFSGGRPVPGTEVIVARPGMDGRGLFLMPLSTAAPDPPSPAPPAAAAPAPPQQTRLGNVRSGYRMATADGRVFTFGAARHYGDATPFLKGANVVDMERTPSGEGYWVVDDLGHVYSFGDAGYFGNVDQRALPGTERVTSLSATRSGAGYWIFTSRGRVLSFGDARFFGDTAGLVLNRPVLDSIPTTSGLGYYLVAADGGIFSFGDAKFYGSMGGKRLNQPVQSLVPDPDGKGYWLVAADGGVFAFDASFRGSMGGRPLNAPVTGMITFGNGYLMAATDGGVFDFSDRPFNGSLAGYPLGHPVVSVAGLD